jgi:hypothetical protein
LKDINAPLNAFTCFLTWAAKTNEDGNQFNSDRIPSREKVIQNLFARYNMKGLSPRSHLCISLNGKFPWYALLLSCPTINKDENFLFHEQERRHLQTSNLGNIDASLLQENLQSAGEDNMPPKLLYQSNPQRTNEHTWKFNILG